MIGALFMHVELPSRAGSSWDTRISASHIAGSKSYTFLELSLVAYCFQPFAPPTLEGSYAKLLPLVFGMSRPIRLDGQQIPY